MTDGCDQLAALVELPNEFEHFLIPPQLVGHPPARAEDALKVVSFHIANGGVRRTRVTVLAGVSLIGLLPGEGHRHARFGHAQLGIPKFEILVIVADETEEFETVQGGSGHEGVRSI